MSAPGEVLSELAGSPLREPGPLNVESAAAPAEPVAQASQPTSARAGSADGTSSRSKEKHSATEKRRRDRIHEGMTSLREVVVPQKEKEDQAAFLKSAAEYIRQLQTALQCFTAMGAVKNLPEEAQWSIRALLSRGLTSAAAAGPAPQLSFPGLPQVLLQLMSNMNTTKQEEVPAQGPDPAQVMQQALLAQQWQHMQQCAAQAQSFHAFQAAQAGQPNSMTCHEPQPQPPVLDAGAAKEQ